MRAVSFVGVSGSGKTTLVVRLIEELARRGVRVAAIKHTHHRDVAAAPAGKDSERMAAAGADAVVLVGPTRMLASEPVRAEPSIHEVMLRLPPSDLVLVESWKSARLPCIEVVAPGGERVAAIDGGDRIAIVAEPSVPAPAGARRFTRDDVDGLATFLVRWARS